MGCNNSVFGGWGIGATVLRTACEGRLAGLAVSLSLFCLGSENFKQKSTKNGQKRVVS